MNLHPNPMLSIALPTYNRADFLESSLAAHIPILKRHNIQIFVSDNASTDETSRVVEKWKRGYPLLHYSINSENMGPDLNFQHALELSDTTYTWLLGDTSELHADDIEKVLDLLSTQGPYDAVIVNLLGKVDLPSRTYQEPSSLLEDLGGLMSCMSCLIYSKSMIATANFSRFHNSNFLQTGIIFESIAQRSFLIHWLQHVSVTSLESGSLTKSSWAHTRNIFKIGLDSWANLIFSLPVAYSLKSKLKACTGFGEISGAFTLRGMISLRSRGLLDYSVYKEYRNTLKVSLRYPAWMVLAISLIPRSLLNTAVSVYLKRTSQIPSRPSH